MSSTVDKVKSIADPVAQENGFELVDIEYVKEGKNWFLRLFIDKATGIDLDDCALFSEKVSEKLDSETPDPIPHAYYLEVSSPGAEKPLKTEEALTSAIGDYVHFSLYEPLAGEKVYEGTLKDVNSNEAVLDVKDKTRIKTVIIPRKNIAKARLAIKF
ncbi:ribosome maturation factor RimP [Lacticigenium naphthae]|uniref:ribosome maturation factor RimP n=1 Tax=Lacticigenium naphthae TaxID=515351 RepID=UPI0003F80E2B|nr:ribosome maturation factor RimP [Lacticigenium naphthae]